MNHTATPFTIFPITDQVAERKDRDFKSLLKRVLARLASYASSDRRAIREYRRNYSFIDEYLLDPRMGPEISRSLRR